MSWSYPPCRRYLCGYWALKDPGSYPAGQILKVIYQEMLHFGLACNMLCATGKQPEVLNGYQRIVYPGPLPGGVVPECDGKLIPCDPQFQVMLGFSDFKAFTWMCAQVEYPENPVPRPPLLTGTAGGFPTIGQFYDAVLEAFRENDGKFTYNVANQRNGALGLYLIDKFDKAVMAIKTIQQQGEGGSRNPYSAPNQLSHFYAFGELYYRKKYVYNAAAETGDWTGAAIPIPDDAVYQVTPVPKGGYSSSPPEVSDFDRAFTQMLAHLEGAWAGGGSAELNAAIQIMPELSSKAVAILSKQTSRPDGPGIFGPQFRIAH